MNDSKLSSNFLTKLRDIIHQNISNEQFGVSELANNVGMSRSNLLRRVKKETGSSVSVFIRDVRLEYSMDLLKDSDLTVSEISYKVGFNSPSYYIKCFHDKFGFSPGDKSKLPESAAAEKEEVFVTEQKKRNGSLVVVLSIILIIVLAVVIYFSWSKLKFVNIPKDKSIAVLPFINDSDDSSNIYIINGLMESVLGNLQKISDLRVISRTSVEKFRNSNKTIPEIAEELDVRYFVEGSGQKVGNKLLLSVQLIDAVGDKRIWSDQYDRDADDIFKIQKELAHSISDNIGAIITPEEMGRIDKVPTTNLVAYDLFLKGLDLFIKAGETNLNDAIDYFKMAIDEDPDFARAYADIAIAYYLLDENKSDKVYTEQINAYAEMAFLLDNELEQSYIAKALYYQHIGQYEQEVPFLEKALEINPNSAIVVGMLAHIYTSYLPDTRKYLEYAIIGSKLDIQSYDSITTSFTYLHISNALIQNGLVKEAKDYINKSLDYDPNNIYSKTVKSYILFAETGNIELTKNMLLETFKMDTNRLDVLQEIGKIYYFMNNWDSSYYYYQKYLTKKNAYGLDIYPGENSKIALVCKNIGNDSLSDILIEEYRNYAENNSTVYKTLSLAAYYAIMGENEKSLSYLRYFSNEDDYFYWIPLFLEIDPIFADIESDIRFIEVNEKIKDKAIKNRDEMREMLIGKGILD